MSNLQTRCQTCKQVLFDLEKDKVYECLCDVLRRRKLALPPDARLVDPTERHLNHELMKPGTEKRSLFILAHWGDMRAFIKVLMLKHLSMRLKVVTDTDLRDAYVGSMSKASKSADYVGDVFNNIADLIDEAHLVIIRLNVLANKNKAAAGALEEGLVHRLYKEKPTWVVSDPDRPFQRGSHAWSESVSDLLGTSYHRMSIPRIFPRMSVDDAFLVPDAVDPIQTGARSADADSPPARRAAATAEAPRTSLLGESEGAPARSSRPLRESKPKIRSSRKPDDDDGLPDATPDALGMYGSGLPQRRGRGS